MTPAFSHDKLTSNDTMTYGNCYMTLEDNITNPKSHDILCNMTY